MSHSPASTRQGENAGKARGCQSWEPFDKLNEPVMLCFERIRLRSLPARGVRLLRDPRLLVAGGALLLATSALLLHPILALLLASSGGICIGLALQRWQRSSAGAPHPNAGFLESVNLAADAAGVRIFDWDLRRHHLTPDRNGLHVYDEHAHADAAAPDEFMRRGVHAEDLVHFRHEVRKALKYRDDVLISYRALLSDGSARPVQLHGQVLRDAEGRPIRVLGVIVDISTQLAAMQHIEQQAREQQLTLERLDITSETARVGILDWDLVSGQLATAGHITQQFALAGGSTHAALQVLEKIVHPEDWERFHQTITAALAAGDSLEHGWNNIPCRSSPRPVEHCLRQLTDEFHRAASFLDAQLPQDLANAG